MSQRLVTLLSRILDFVWSPCPSGMPHRVRQGVVTNHLGKSYCWHRDCMRANFAECGVTTCTYPRCLTEGCDKRCSGAVPSGVPGSAKTSDGGSNS